jgi:dTDP-4-dehydrorhamnose reductase
MPRVLLLGSGGQLGMQLKAALLRPDCDFVDVIALSRRELDFTDLDAIRTAIRQAEPEIVINAAAYTAVDKAEQEPELARVVNAAAPSLIAEEVNKTKGWLIHYSTDYVFNGSGTEPWRETDETGPLSVYGQTKLEGERGIAATGCQHIILRTSWVYAAEGRNFLHTMLRLGRERDLLKVVDDQVGAPTSAEAISRATMVVLSHLGAGGDATDKSGLYHLTCKGATSWFGFAQGIFTEFASRQNCPEVLPIPSEAYPTPAHRPKNSRLCCDKFVETFGFRMPEWRDALHTVAQKIAIENNP